ncbi:SPOR domain-containing protein [Rehaibacterium terrae]|jgi:hypothetical protein|uniref:SPOR domain-containing protein n=1 Tax=Rehaibacterium terrae TaxID=1341696 RepID=A0A7W7XZL0_9GAMM|nr:SPOR domain-containing protein [Rehaibacterium terrae]MBB5015357.1 hypothetical protein [Rehaibacterium terrae]
MLVRLLFVLLFAMNLAVAGWWWLRPQAETPVPAPTDPGVPALVLLGEAELASAPAIEAEPDSPPEPLSATPRCLTLGPFPSPADLRRVMNALQPVAGHLQLRETRSAQLRGYRVFLPASASRQQALETARQLAARGLNDYYVVAAGDEQNTISLGLFRDLANAERRREEVRALGFEPRLEPRTEESAQWWLDAAVPEDFDVRELLRPWPGSEARDVACR